MKISLALFVSAVAILLSGCESNQPLMTDEAYDARHPPAPYSADPSGRLPQPANSTGRNY